MSEGDNGSKSEEVLREEAFEARKARFAQNPDSFVELSELIIAVKRCPQGMAMLIGAKSKQELEVAQAELNFEIHLAYVRMRAEALREAAPRIQKPGGIVNFVRGGLRRN